MTDERKESDNQFEKQDHKDENDGLKEEKDRLKLLEASKSKKDAYNRRKTMKVSLHKPVLTISHDQLNKKLKKKPILWSRIFYQFYFFGVGIVLLVLSIYSFNDYSVQQTQFKQLTNNWSQKFILKLNLSDSSNTCNDTFPNQMENYGYYEWPGSYDGCDCTFNRRLLQTDDKTLNSTDQNSTKIIDPIVSYFDVNRRCSYQELQSGCTTIDAQDLKQMPLWNDGEYSRHNVQKDGKCPKGTKACGKKMKVCVNETSLCPIDRIGFVQPLTGGYELWQQRDDPVRDEKIAQMQRLYEEDKWDEAEEIGGYIQLHRNFAFYYFRDSSEDYPMASMRIGEMFQQGGVVERGVCVDTNKLNISPNRSDYLLMKKQKRECDSDGRYDLVHVISEQQFYLSNNMINLPEDLPFYEIRENYTWGIFTAPNIHWNDTCKGDLLHRTVELAHSIDDIQESQSVQLGIAITYFIIISCVFSLFSCLSACGFEFSCIDSQQKHQYNRIFILEVAIKMIIQIAQILSVILTFVLIEEKKALLQELVDKECYVDQQTKIIIENLVVQFNDKNWEFDLGILALFSITIIVDLIILMISIKKGKHLGIQRQSGIGKTNNASQPYQIPDDNDEDHDKPEKQELPGSNENENKGQFEVEKVKSDEQQKQQEENNA